MDTRELIERCEACLSHARATPANDTMQTALEYRLVEALTALSSQAAEIERLREARRLTADDVEWVVNDIAELGVKIGDQFFFLYKGSSLVYGALDDDPTVPPVHEDGNLKTGFKAGDRMKWRPVFKREFGECAHPINYSDPTRIGTVSLSESDEWEDIPAALTPKPNKADGASE